ncbi:hypothetical protein I6U48_25250, partial [Clostridium sp. PL3]
MLNKKILVSLFIFIFSIFIFNPTSSFASNYNVSSSSKSDYYVSNSGDDNNSGLSEAHPWKSISKVNNYNFKPGDVIHFKCGDIWREQLIPKNGNETGPVTYTSYGSGNKPYFYGSVSLNRPSDWIEETSNIWTSNKNTENTQSASNYINLNRFLIWQEKGAKVNYDSNTVRNVFIKIDSLSTGTSMFNVQLLVAGLNLTTN